MVRSAWRWLLGAPNRGTHKNKVNEISPDIRKVAGLPIMRRLIEPLGQRQGISLICLRRLLPNTRQTGIWEIRAEVCSQTITQPTDCYRLYDFARFGRRRGLV